MSWNFRKSTKIGPLRITASKSGLSYSIGTKGFRVTKQANGKIRKTYSIPRTGLSYSETISSSKPSKKALKEVEYAHMMAPQWLKIAEESAKICNETVNPETFFSRFDLMLEKLGQLAEIEHLVSFSGEPPSAAYQRIQQQRPALIHNMIERSYNRMIAEARSLKTKKGQDNKLVRYFTTMNTYSEQIGKDGMIYLQSLMEKHIVR